MAKDVLPLGHHLRRTSKGVEKALEAWRTSEDVRNKMEAKTDSTSF